MSSIVIRTQIVFMLMSKQCSFTTGSQQLSSYALDHNLSLHLLLMSLCNSNHRICPFIYHWARDLSFYLLLNKRPVLSFNIGQRIYPSIYHLVKDMSFHLPLSKGSILSSTTLNKKAVFSFTTE